VDRLTGNNTIVVFTSDHGEMLGDHYLWRKQRALEPSARVPFLIRAPARFGLRRNAVVERPCMLEDIMPTLLEMAGAGIPPSVEGRSLLPLLRGEDAPWRDYVHIEHAPLQQALTDGREKYIWEVPTGRELFFDLAADPRECTNLAAGPRHAGRVEQWRGRLIKELQGRPEGFTDGRKLIPGRDYPPVMAWHRPAKP
jgi:arylsulfatase A-like enzyme